MRLSHVCVVLALIGSTAAYADIIRLKSGRVINGTYLGGSPREVKVQIGDSVETLNVSDISRIEFAGGDQGSIDSNRPQLRRAPSAGYPDDDGRPTLRRSESAPPPPPPADDYPPTLRRGESASGGTPVPIMRPSDSGASAASTAASVAQQGPLEVPAGTNFVVRMIEPIDSSTGGVGQSYRAAMDQPVMVNGQMVIQRGADVTVKLVNDEQSGRLAGKTVLTLQLATVNVNGRIVDIRTQNVTKESDSRGKKTATMAAGGAILGAVIGGIAGGGKGAAVGAGAGGAAGAGAEAATKGEKVKIPSETLLTFVLDNPVTI
jgi:hypothetical protein